MYLLLGSTKSYRFSCEATDGSVSQWRENLGNGERKRLPDGVEAISLTGSGILEGMF
jgi:hypothetical protein